MKRTVPFAIALLVRLVVDAPAQSSIEAPREQVTIDVVRDLVQIRAKTFHFIQGESLARLKDGHPVRFDVELTVLARPEGSAFTRNRQSFNLSYDLWEERFAATRIGKPSASISHLTLADAEAWCLEQLALPLQALRQLAAGKPFWIRLEYRVPDPEDVSSPEVDGPLTLRRMIDMLSRRRRAGEIGDSVTAGPFRVSN